MAKITIKISTTGEEIPILGLDLKDTTDIQLLDECVSSGIIPYRYNEYDFYCINFRPYTILSIFSNEGVSLSDLGFADGDTIVIRNFPHGSLSTFM